MADLDLQGLINEIMGMVKDRNKNKPSATDLSEQEYWKDIRKRNTDLEVEGTKSAGEMARQRLMGDSEKEKAEITARAHLAGEEAKAGATRYTADKTVEMHKKGLYPEQMKAYSAMLADISTPEEDRVKARERILKDYSGQETTPNVRSFDDNKDTPSLGLPPVTKPSTDLTGAKSMVFSSAPTASEILAKKKQANEKFLHGQGAKINRGLFD